MLSQTSNQNACEYGMTMMGRSRKSFLANLCCPNGCEAAVVVREEEEEIFYKDRDYNTDWAWIDFAIAVRVPVFLCERCGMGWTDHQAEDIRAVAIVADQMARKIDYDVLQSLKKDA